MAKGSVQLVTAFAYILLMLVLAMVAFAIASKYLF